MFELFEYNLPFRSPFKTGSAVFENRKGILLHYKNNHTDIVTEAAPLPGFSQESLDDVKQVLINQKDFITDFLDGNLTLQKIRDLDDNPALKAPPIQFAVSFLALFILAEKKGKTIYDLFRTIPATTIQVNEVIGHSSPDEMKKLIENAIQNGFKVIKVKAPHPVEELAGLLSDVQKKYPSILFRLDANQTWPVSSLEQNSELFRNFRIQYIEEPTSVKNLDEISNLQEKCSIPIALDESISSIAALKTILERHPEIFVIIKPMLLGNILRIHETISQIRGSFKHIVCTTSLESSIGRSMVAITASLTGDPTISHGLNTGHLFANDLLPDLKIENGSLKDHQKITAVKSFQSIKTSHLKKLG